MDTLPELKAILDASGTMLNWALILAGGSVAALVTSTADRPKGWWRLMYLLFLLAWFCLGHSLDDGFHISRKYVAAIVANGKTNEISKTTNANTTVRIPMLKKTSATENLLKIFGGINRLFASQMWWLFAALIVLALWLVFFLIWFVFFHFSDDALTNAQKAGAENAAADLASKRSIDARTAAERAKGDAIAARTAANEARTAAGDALRAKADAKKKPKKENRARKTSSNET